MKQHIFKTFIFLMAAAASVAIHAQTSTQNYVKTEAFINGNGGKVTTVQYCDGLGRPVLTATDGTGSNGSFVYTRQHYDYGQRVASQTIPAYGNSSPDFLTDAQLSWKYADTHRSTTFQYDALDRVITEKGPGDEWHASNRFRHTAYQLNGAGEVKLYRVSSNTLQQSGYYPAGRLYVEEYTDEDQNATRIYKDMQGRTVMQRQGSDSDTYYVYDAAGNLRYVLPPAASAGLSGGSWTMASSAVLQQFAYYYEYDSRARCTRKQLPGCDYVTMTYDTNDRLVTSQDGNQRLSNVCTYYEYDNLGRQTVMGVDTAGVRTPLLETFYDDYTFLTSEESAKVGFNASGGYHSSYASAHGLQTGSRVHHLEKTSLYEVTAMYYDALGNMIQSRSTNHLSGNDDVYIQYNEYTGAELQRRHVHSASGKPTRTEVCTNTYDYAGRLQSVSHKLGDNAPVTISSLTYDEYGRLASKTVGDNIQTVSYSYNIRDWATSISSTHFSEQLAYTGTNGAASAATPCFNGNIAAMAWKAGTETAYRNYQFSYNAKGWLTSATYSGTGSYSVQYQYDPMGNVTSLQRYGLQDNSQYGLIDNLSYTYNGNQLVTVTDGSSGPNYSGAFHFSDGADEDVEYEYDQNGNLTKDLNKKITQIKYNLLNLPSSITYQNGNMASYVYSAAGGKLSVSYQTGTGNTSTQYCGNIIYDNNNLSQVLIDGGYITFSGTTPQYHYYLQDHLGNNRVVVKQDGTIEQVNHYYPFGGLFGESTNGDVQRFKYNGKELERMHGLDWYDYGARHLDAALGRWSTIDPMAEEYYNLSPYNYCGNNPINAIDMNGLKPDSISAALMSLLAYGYNGDAYQELTEHNWFFVSHHESASGFKYNVYKKEKDDGSFEYTLAYAGTDPDSGKVEFAKDALCDAGNFLGLITPQYIEAAITALGISGKELTFVGHSLGGALAALSSKLTGKDAITFNPASLTGEIKTLASVVSLFRGGHITQYRAVGNGFFGGLLGDPVNTIQNLTRRSSQGKVIPVYVGKNFSHSIEAIIAAFHKNGIR